MKANREAAIIVALTIAIPLSFALYMVVNLLLLRNAYQGEIDHIEPRIARYMGIMQFEERLIESAESVESRLLNLVYPQTEDAATVAATLQSDVRGIMSAAGLEVTNSRVEPVRRDGIFDVVGLTVSITGGVDALDAALLEVAAYTPLLLIDSINIAPQRSRRNREGAAEQILKTRIHLSALRSVK